MPRVVHFEIHADDPKRAIKFYQDVFGWEIVKQDTEGNVFGIHEADESAQ
jgi:catechol 2,3-dioxygenase-like lactoylglutathione lyase family enzyme